MEDLFTRVMQMQLQTQTQMEMQASWHVQSKHKEKEIRKRSRSIFRRWPTMIELFTESHCGKRTQKQAQENENLFIPCVDACVYICIYVGLVHKCNSLHLHLCFYVIDWPS